MRVMKFEFECSKEVLCFYSKTMNNDYNSVNNSTVTRLRSKQSFVCEPAVRFRHLANDDSLITDS